MLDFKNITHEKLDSILRSYIEEYLKLSDTVNKTNDHELSYQVIIQNFLDLNDQFQGDLALFHMEHFHVDEEIRKHCSLVNTNLSRFMIEQSARRDQYEKFRYYYDHIFPYESVSLTSEQNTYVNECQNNYMISGFHLPNDQFEILTKHKLMISDLSTQFSWNLNSENKTMIFSENELEGLPKEWLEQHHQNDNTYQVSLKYPDYIPIMEYCSVRETRKKMFFEFNNRCFHENSQIAKDIFGLRNQLAKIMGYEKFSDFALQKMMAENSDRVMSFLAQIQTQIKPLLDQDLDDLRKIAQKDQINDNDIQYYDIPYYSRIFIDKSCDFKKESLREYFTVSSVVNGMFEIYQTLFGFRFEKVLDPQNLWHPDVEMFSVYNTHGTQPIGHFFLDLFPRNGKYNHAAMFPFINKSAKNDPLICIACNFSPNGKLSFDEVETFFHEFGHCIHALSSECSIESLSGTNCERDFVETPSQMFEEWCYVPEIIQMMSAKPIDIITIQKLRQQRYILQGYHYARQLVFAFTDQKIHGSYDHDDNDPQKIYLDTLREIIDIPFPEEFVKETNFIASFGHLINGYQSLYYGYLWSLVYSKELYHSLFKGNELNPEIGQKFRKEILSYGGSRKSIESLRIILQREPSISAFIDSIKYPE